MENPVKNKKFSTQNWDKRTDRNWKKIADFALYTIPLYNGVVLNMPLNDTVQKWVLVILNTTIVIFKGVSKFTKDAEDYGEVSDKEQDSSNT